MRFNRPYTAREHYLAFQLAFVFVQVGFGLNVEVNNFAHQFALRAGRPRFRKCDQRYGLRFDHLRGEAMQRPSASERTPRLEARVGQSPRSELVTSPRGGPPEVRRIRRPRADDFSEVAQRVHQPRAIQRLILDSRDRIAAVFCTGRRRGSLRNRLRRNRERNRRLGLY